MDREHLVIRREDYVAGTRARPEVGIFTQTHAARPPVPWGRIGTGEKVWMKWSGGPVVAVATVTGVRQFERCTPELLRASTVGFKLHELNDYWTKLPPAFFGLTVYLGDEHWLDEAFLPEGRSRGESWFVLDTDEARRQWLSSTEREAPGSRPGARSGRGSRTVPLTLRFQVLRRDDFRCTYCGRKPPEVVLHIDHVEAFSSGGLTKLDNLRTACSDCNLGKGATRL
ncbi:HNH endonuclease [Anaeromyxobacter sp. PSR-1]|uniref:HNH endonuclease n=1 Tax=Anaeromyxobacter sp. PSR-1 TaxID=1300915 RepID=UPI0009E3A4D3|nr:HNH endonuclease signature motif containing protein [Anaeromyxobacter sp. PSR-1]